MENNNITSKTDFKTGEYVIYEANGVCLISEITTLDWSNVPKDKLYYVLHPLNMNNGVIYIPVENAETRLKRLLTKDEVFNLIDQMPSIPPLDASNEKILEATYRDCMRTFDRIEWIKLIKCIYMRIQKRKKEGKKCTTVDERYMQLATEALYSEFSLVLDIQKNEVEDFICQKFK